MTQRNAISTHLATIPAHKFLHIQNRESNGYWDFWQKQSLIPGGDQATITALLAGIDGVLDDGAQVMAYINDPDGRLCDWGFKRTECWGVRVAAEYSGEVPPPLRVHDVPDGEYLVFEHGPFDAVTENGVVEEAIETAMAGFNFDSTDFRLDFSPGRVMYFQYEPERFWKYVRPVRKK